MARSPAYPAEIIGGELVAAREQGVKWAALMAKYGLKRTRLYQLWAVARNGNKDVHEHKKTCS